VHEDPVSVHHHLPGYFSVAGFIRVPQVPLAQICEIEETQECNEEADLNPFLGK
jgi:hypothetical protein